MNSTEWNNPDRIDAEICGRAGAPREHPEFDRLVRTIWRLRQPDGCPWDREQTHASIAKNMIEEAYEAKEAIVAAEAAAAAEEPTVAATATASAREHLIEELGDVLEQVLLHAQIAADEQDFDIDIVARALNTKLISRHPHVFGDTHAVSGAEALASWDAAKTQERNGKAGERRKQGLLDSIPHSLPALMQCQKISQRAAKAGFEWPSVEEVWDKVEEERREFLAEDCGSKARFEEFGDMLFALVNVARHEGIDAEEALCAANKKFRSRWAAMEKVASEHACSLADLSCDELNILWEHVKIEEG